jgi:sugar phosphate isomerase/epimerase
MKRREFIQTSAFTVAGLVSLPIFMQAGKGKSSVGLQLYSLRDSIFKDPKGVLQKVASFGYKELETFAYGDGKIYGMPFNEFAKFCKGLGMKVCSGHYGLDLVKSDKWEQAVTDAKAIGQDYMIMPYIQEPDRKSIDNYKSICEALNKAGEVCNKNGVRFGYHNHAFEFDTVDGQIPYDVMLKELDPKLVGMELDIYWVYRAGKDPLQMFQQNPGRFEQWHVKDMDKNNKDRNADVGTGSIDWKPIFAKAKQSGMKHFYIEQETYPGEPIDSVAACIKNLQTIL